MCSAIRSMYATDARHDSIDGARTTMTSLKGAVVLVTGANGGIGTHFVRESLARGAAKVYATARTPRDWDDDRIVSLALDITDQQSIEAAVRAGPDVTILINNAGASVSTPGILTHTDEEIRRNVETNFLGPLFLARGFAPILSAHGGNTAIINIHSVLSWWAVAGSTPRPRRPCGHRPIPCAWSCNPPGSRSSVSMSAMSTPRWPRTPPAPNSIPRTW